MNIANKASNTSTAASDKYGAATGLSAFGAANFQGQLGGRVGSGKAVGLRKVRR